MSTLRAPAHPPASVAVVGRGRLGVVLARALREAGIEVLGPTGRGEPVGDADVVLLCVPDSAIASAARNLSGHRGLIGHTSGATPLDDVDLGVHPLQTFTGSEEPSVFHGIACAVAGRDDDALAVAARIAELLGARPVAIDDARRAGYHAAASIASNFLVTLQDTAERVAVSSGIDAPTARAMLAPLVRQTIENWAALGPAAALTGPVARGDSDTVARQRQAVAEVPELLPLFDELCARTADLSQRKDVA
ncbi:Rossmann-like and DUF2520 domain-containing protein [Microbacterium gilvum]|uniref:Rossmann-like and DUF2520 domain-containing protein n=1 Tax=Microbacterium gilvum TaxID=1336204 RepID=UPI0031E612C8